MQSLLLLQIGCCVATGMMALMLVLSRLHTPRVHSDYEASRWLLFAAMAIFCMQYLIQIVFDFGAVNYQEGAMINILFFVPAVCLIAGAIVHIANRTNLLRTNRTTFRMAALVVLTLAMPIAFFSTSVLMVVSPLFMVALLNFVISFICMSTHIAAIRQAQEATPTEAPCELVSDEGLLSEAYMELLKQKIDRWHAERGYSDCNLNMTIMAKQLDVPTKDLSQYLLQQYGQTFRIWLSALRIEEVKLLLMEHDDYTIEAIADKCGFSSRSWLQQKFKAETGLTPNEWKVTYRNNYLDE